jgi:hypothetical protein
MPLLHRKCKQGCEGRKSDGRVSWNPLVPAKAGTQTHGWEQAALDPSISAFTRVFDALCAGMSGRECLDLNGICSRGVRGYHSAIGTGSATSIPSQLIPQRYAMASTPMARAASKAAP